MGGEANGDDEGNPFPSPYPPPPPRRYQMQEEYTQKQAPVAVVVASRSRDRSGGAVRRQRVHSIRARAAASVVYELSQRMGRFERGEGGGVT